MRAPSRTVMVFVHGGGHVQGSTSQVTSGVTLYDGAHLAATGNVVVVTVQYRLGALGWLADDTLGTAKQPAGNYGLLDQMAALRWVQTNITRFGGDPKTRARVRRIGRRGRHVPARGQSARNRLVLARADGERRVRPPATRPPPSSAATFQSAAGCTNVPDVAACLRALPRRRAAHHAEHRRSRDDRASALRARR